MSGGRALPEVVKQRRVPPRGELLGIAGLLLSVVIALINAYYAARGSEIVVQAPEQILLYRDGEGERAILTAAMRVVLLNSASAEHGDVMLTASLKPARAGPTFKFQAVAQPVFSETPGECPAQTRCITHPGLRIQEEIDALVDLPGGGARVRYLSFPLTTANCSDAEGLCARFPDFDGAVASLGDPGRTYEVETVFHGDGKRSLRCGTSRLDSTYLRRIGWVSVGCVTASASPAPWL